MPVLLRLEGIECGEECHLEGTSELDLGLGGRITIQSQFPVNHKPSALAA